MEIIFHALISPTRSSTPDSPNRFTFHDSQFTGYFLLLKNHSKTKFFQLMDLTIISAVGARPNFIKLAPFAEAINQYNANSANKKKIRHIIVHTGQHYDISMSRSFFKDLNIPEPDLNLEIGSGSHAEQVGSTMIEFEKVIREIRPDWVVVFGDVNATLACSVTAKKEKIRCCHVEAGLRSGDITMPEEINRLVTDRLCDLLLTPDRISKQNLIMEGTSENKIRFVGNIMIDSLNRFIETASQLDLNQVIQKNLLVSNKSKQFRVQEDHVVLTLHRPSNVDDKEILERIVKCISQDIAGELQVIWPVHPRTKKQISEFGLGYYIDSADNLIMLNPIGYHEMLKACMDSRMIITDSGGLQEEATILGKFCLTLRNSTERPITLLENGGVSVLVGNDTDLLLKEFRNELNNPKIKPVIPELWDGNTGYRCLQAILDAN